MTDIFTQGIIEDLDRRQSGQAFDIEVDQFGVPRYVPKADMMQPFEGAQDQTDPFAIAGEVTPVTPAEFAEKTFEVGVGAVGGAAAATIGLPGDVAGIVKGITDAAGAEQGQKFQAFLQGLSDVSSVIGSERTTRIFEEAVNALPIDQASKQNIMAGSKYIGEFAEIPVAGGAAVKGFTELADAVKGMRAENYIFPYDALPQRTVVADNLENWNELQQNLKFSQPIESVEDAIEVAQRNQAILADNGPQIASQTGATFKNPGVKGQDDQGRRMAEKIADKGNVRELTDVTRAGFAVDSPAQADQVVDLLAQNYKVIDEGYNVSPVGYFDRKILVVNPNGQIGEVQIWPKEMFSAKLEQGGQDLYVTIRDKASTPEQIQEAISQSVDLYSEALNQMTPDMRQIALDSLNKTIEKGGKNAEQAQMVLDKLEAAQ